MLARCIIGVGTKTASNVPLQHSDIPPNLEVTDEVLERTAGTDINNVWVFKYGWKWLPFNLKSQPSVSQKRSCYLPDQIINKSCCSFNFTQSRHHWLHLHAYEYFTIILKINIFRIWYSSWSPGFLRHLQHAAAQSQSPGDLSEKRHQGAEMV